MTPVSISGLGAQKIGRLGLGVFDGLHQGHQDIVDRSDAILTFWPHPDIVLGKNKTLQHLTTIPELKALAKRVLVLKFNRDIAQLSAHTFLDQVVRDHIRPSGLVVGYDFRFGAKQTGNIAFLQTWTQQNGMSLDVVPAKCIDGHPIKSSEIRPKLAGDAFDAAVQLLGHPYLIQGLVVKGDGRGTALGFPTANIRVPKWKLLPACGVYAGYVKIGRQPRSAMIYVGSKPTFGPGQTGIEVHIPSFSAPLYGKRLNVFLTRFVRGEMKFSSADRLVAQIRHDLSSLETQTVSEL